MKPLLLCLLLTGCMGTCRQFEALKDGYTKFCVDGVSWLLIHGDYAAVNVDENGKPRRCDK